MIKCFIIHHGTGIDDKLLVEFGIDMAWQMLFNETPLLHKKPSEIETTSNIEDLLWDNHDLQNFFKYEQNNVEIIILDKKKYSVNKIALELINKLFRDYHLTVNFNSDRGLLGVVAYTQEHEDIIRKLTGTKPISAS